MSRILIIGYVWPEPNTTAAGNRMLQLLAAFLDKEHQVIFASTASKTKYSHDLKAMGITEKQIRLNHSDFDHFMKDLKPVMVVFDRFMIEEQFGWRVAEACPTALRILNTEDLHSLREYRETCFKGHKEWSIDGWLQQDKTKREIASIYRSDLTLLISSFEAELLSEHLKINTELLLHLPFMLPTLSDRQQKDWPSFTERSGFISFGSGHHAPNLDSYRYLKDTIWPLIRKKLPNALLNVYGAYFPQYIHEMHNPKEGFMVHGWVDHLEEKVKQARFLLAPLRFGAGIKGKLTMAMQNGTPSITTPIGAEGMGALDWPGHIANHHDDFVEQAVQLYEDEKRWNGMQARGIQLINSFYSKEVLSKKLFGRLEVLRSALKKHRATNFVGGILQHQTIAATKYMSKWIEEKNKSKM